MRRATVVAVKDEEVQEEREEVLKANRFEILAAESERFFQPAGVSAVSPCENNQKGKKKKETQWRMSLGECSERAQRVLLSERREVMSEKQQCERGRETRAQYRARKRWRSATCTTRCSGVGARTVYKDERSRTGT